MKRIYTSLLIGLCVAGLSGSANAARSPNAPATVDGSLIEKPVSNPLVVRMQKALGEAGYYKGAIDGIAGQETIEAVKAYQRSENQVVDGIISEALVVHMETSSKVRLLLNQLHEKRLANIRTAREALLSRPETRDILTGKKNETADPTRDPSECFRTPTPECLLDEAAESAKGISKRELRDWAFGEILSAQAKAGLVNAAIDSVRLIGDARLIMVALRDIAEAQALTGRPAEALAAADIIPDVIKQSEALAAIAAIQISQGNMDGATTTARRIISGLDGIEDLLKRVVLRLKAAVVLFLTGDEAASNAQLNMARTVADTASEEIRAVILRHVAGALAEMAKPGAALDIIADLPEASEQTPVLISAATAQTEAGDLERAIHTAEAIQAVRYRAVVLAHIAIAQATAGNDSEARQTVDKAIASATQIKLPFARAYAHDRIARALTEIGRAGDAEAFETAIDLAAKIIDDKLRAHRLWSIAAAQRMTGDGPGADDTARQAEQATVKIKSALTRTWMFADIALERFADGNNTAAWAAFHRALGIADKITNGWARARALARLASTQIELSEPNSSVVGNKE